MSAPSGNDFLTAKSDAELHFIVQNTAYYHPDLVQSAQRELRHRGLALALLPKYPQPEAAAFDEPAPARRWLVPAAGGALLVLGIGALLLRPGAAESPQKARPAPPAELVAVETHMLPCFDAQTNEQLRKMPAAQPPGEAADTTARRKYLLLARRFWDAENQSAYLYEQVRAGKVAAALPGQIETTQDKWHRLTSVLVYDHKLQPGMTARVELMQQAAAVRMSSLQGMSQRCQVGEFPLTDELVFFNDSVQYLRQLLLGVPAGSRQRPVLRHHDFSALTPDAVSVKTIPEAHGIRNPLYVLDGEPLASDPSTGAAPAAVRNLGPDEIDNISVLKAKVAVPLYGPRAHDGAVVITTRHASR